MLTVRIKKGWGDGYTALVTAKQMEKMQNNGYSVEIIEPRMGDELLWK